MCGLCGVCPPVDTSFAVEHAASGGMAAKCGSASIASMRSERGSKNGRDRAAPDTKTAADIKTAPETVRI
jgi:hypothetical protein